MATNLGFETAGASPGLADGWTLATSSVQQDQALFDAVGEALEDFEEGWRLPMLTPGFVYLGRLDLGTGVFTDGNSLPASVYTALVRARIATPGVGATPVDPVGVALTYVREDGAPSGPGTVTFPTETVLVVGDVFDAQLLAGDAGLSDVLGASAFGPARTDVADLYAYRRISWLEHHGSGTEPSSDVTNEYAKMAFAAVDLKPARFDVAEFEGFGYHWRNDAGFQSNFDLLVSGVAALGGGAGNVETFGYGWRAPGENYYDLGTFRPHDAVWVDGDAVPAPYASRVHARLEQAAALQGTTLPLATTALRLTVTYRNQTNAVRTGVAYLNLRATAGEAGSAVDVPDEGHLHLLTLQTGDLLQNVDSVSRDYGHFDAHTFPAGEVMRSRAPLRTTETDTFAVDAPTGGTLTAYVALEALQDGLPVLAGVLVGRDVDPTWSVASFTGGGASEGFESGWASNEAGVYDWTDYRPARYADFGASRVEYAGWLTQPNTFVPGATGDRPDFVLDHGAVSEAVTLTITYTDATGVAGRILVVAVPVSGSTIEQLRVTLADDLGARAVTAIAETPPVVHSVAGAILCYGATVAERFNDTDWTLEL